MDQWGRVWMDPTSPGTRPLVGGGRPRGRKEDISRKLGESVCFGKKHLLMLKAALTSLCLSMQRLHNPQNVLVGVAPVPELSVEAKSPGAEQPGTDERIKIVSRGDM